MTASSEFLLRKNDRIVFFGDSITEQQLYTNYVESYLSARFPELELTFFNAGWGGDTAPNSLSRLERDVLSCQPTLVTLCFGMNDGSYCLPNETVKSNYVNGMKTLIARLKAAGIRMVLLTPGMADEAVSENLKAVNYNYGGLRVMADEALALARAEGLPHADLHKLMNMTNDAARAADREFCMIPDGVHPDPAGHLVMAFGLLQALGVPPRHQEVALNYAAKTIAVSPTLSAGRLKKSSRGFSFDIQFDRLPFYVEPLARKVLPFLPFQETYNDIKLTVAALPTARGYFRSATLRSSAFTAETFATGINLCDQWALPVMQQAAKVYRYTLDKDQVFYKLWRSMGLDNKNSPDYNRKAHLAGIKLVPVIDKARSYMVDKKALKSHVEVVATDLPGEPIENGDFIGQWRACGPFPKPHATDKLGGEAALTATVPVLNSQWLAADFDLANMADNCNLFFGVHTDCFAYAITVLDSPLEQSATLLLGSDDGFAVWLNGAQLESKLDLARGLVPDSDRMAVTLRKGKNVLLVKISQGAASWGFCVRFEGLTKGIVSLRA